jgi:hypothetical protein
MYNIPCRKHCRAWRSFFCTSLRDDGCRCGCGRCDGRWSRQGNIDTSTTTCQRAHHCIQAPDRQRLPSLAAICHARSTLRDRVCQEVSAAIGRGGGGQPLPPQPTCSSDHGAVVPYVRHSGYLSSSRKLPPQ